jgi:hypothetical protein
MSSEPARGKWNKKKNGESIKGKTATMNAADACLSISLVKTNDFNFKNTSQPTS